MSMQTITERELVENGVSSLPLTPTASPALGGRDYTPNEVKAAFDRLPRLIAARLNALLGAVTDGTLLADIPVAFGDGTLSLSELLALLGDHLVNPPAPDSAPASESGNTVASGGVYAALAALREEVLSAAKTATDSALRAQKLRYDAATGVLSLAAEEGSAAFDTASLPIPGMQETLSLLRTLLGASVLSETVEDTFTARPTAGGLSVVDEAPTTVHKITGASAVSVNLAAVADQTIVSNGVTFIGSATDGTVQMTGSVTEENEYATATVTSDFYLPVGTYTLYAPHKADKVGWHVRNAQSTSIAELNGNGTTTAVSFTVSAAGSYHLYVLIPRSAGTLDYTETPMLLYGDRTASLPAFEPYYAGIKSAGFKGLLSTGRNLLRPSADTNVTRNGLTYTADASTGIVTITGTKASGDSITSLLGSFDLPKGTYTLYLPHKIQGIGWAVKTMAHAQVGSLSWNTDTKFSSFTVETAGRFYLLAYAIGDGLTVNYTDTPMILPGIVTENFPPFETYHADTTFTLTEAVTVGRWDSLDVDDQKKTTGTALMTFDGTEDWSTEVTQSGDYRLQLQVTGFTVPASANDEPDLVCNLYPPKNANSTYTGMTGISLQDTRLQIYDPSYNAADSVADWKTYLADLAAKGNPLTVAYHRVTPTETPLSLPKTYQAWHGGMEIIDGDPSGLPLTVTQDYYVKAGGESA